MRRLSLNVAVSCLSLLISLSAQAFEPISTQQQNSFTFPSFLTSWFSSSPEAENNPWEKDFENFKNSQKELKDIASKDSVLFLGSSSIRLWSSLRQDLSAQPSLSHYTFINRGFGGSRLSDCAKYTSRIILEQKPKYVVIYAGDNDLAQGAMPEEVKNSFIKTYQNIKTLSPQSKVVYISIKPSPSRYNLIEKINKTNILIEQSVRQINAQIVNQTLLQGKKNLPEVAYLDVYSLMLDDKGIPKDNLFLADKLHMNREGYAIWTNALTQVLKN